ncbi:hypothetical protein HMSSN036_48690 [Paenibacillus macerans]|nr:hypothetical protein HMSSN036_48690 [Paenibacillus macerans]
MRLVFNDQTFSFELLRTLSYAPYGGADIGECLSTAYRIKEGDFESWYTEWYKTAERIQALADDSLKRGNQISAKEFYMRASNYYRTAEFFLHGAPSDPRILETWEKAGPHSAKPFNSWISWSKWKFRMRGPVYRDIFTA